METEAAQCPVLVIVKCLPRPAWTFPPRAAFGVASRGLGGFEGAQG